MLSTIVDMNVRQTADQLTRNFTNLSFKGIIGIQAMAEISRATQNDGDFQMYEVGS